MIYGRLCAVAGLVVLTLAGCVATVPDEAGAVVSPSPEATHTRVPVTPVPAMPSLVSSPTTTLAPDRPTLTSTPVGATPVPTVVTRRIATATPAVSFALTLTVLFDNYPAVPGLETAWGYACLIEGLEQTLLFDTGGDGAMLLRNMDKLGVAPANVDVVVLSHAHGDHTGGLRAFLAANSEVMVYVPQSFSSALKRQVVDAGAGLVEVSGPLEIVPGATLTGEVGSAIREQALALAGPHGLVVLTGCAHPGIVAMVAAAKQATGLAPDLIVGGFHLGSASTVQIDGIVEELQALGVRRAAPSHCSGDLARARFEAAFGTTGAPVGVGTRFVLAP